MDSFFIFFRTGIPPNILYSSLVLTGALILWGLLWRGIKDKRHFTLCLLLFDYLFVVVSSTIIFRSTVTCKFERLALIPFWTYQSVLAHTPGVSIWDIILNVVLFLPLGLLVKLLYPSTTVLRMMGIAILCSLFIETNQYVFEKGVAQFDDVMHNTIGALIGWLSGMVCLKRI